MKTKTIKSVLRRKHDAWLASIKDEHVRKLAAEGSIITGGSIASMLLKESVNDFDIYFRNRETVIAIAKYYVEEFKKSPPTKYKNSDRQVEIFVADGYGAPIEVTADPADPADQRAMRVKVIVKSAGIAGCEGSEKYEYFESLQDESSSAAEDFIGEATAPKKNSDSTPDFHPAYLTSNAISLSGDVQLILRFYGEPDVIHANYDFVHCTNFWTSWDGKLTLRMEALESLLAKELRYIGSKYPLCSIIRTRKFIQRQWTINAGQYLKMAMQLGDLNLNDVAVLEDQLTGVDSAYFHQVISAIKQKDEQTVDRAYLIELIDTIFG
ncbi:hypothetical protein SH668x_001231 [Planctomicrobium sp. SH668]|uniref:hypothetical protein n=1 Tax=Planctomicrobium sp. SH668 TaxID=3448126 RepID=UPI003F5AEC45